MSLQISHILVDIESLGVSAIDLTEEVLDEFSELWVFLLDERLVGFVVTADVGEEVLEVLRVVHY